MATRHLQIIDLSRMNHWTLRVFRKMSVNCGLACVGNFDVSLFLINGNRDFSSSLSELLAMHIGSSPVETLCESRKRKFLFAKSFAITAKQSRKYLRRLKQTNHLFLKQTNKQWFWNKTKTIVLKQNHCFLKCCSENSKLVCYSTSCWCRVRYDIMWSRTKSASRLQWSVKENTI